MRMFAVAFVALFALPFTGAGAAADEYYVDGITRAELMVLLSGFGMVIAGSSAPASGGEHLISHYVDMKHALYGSGLRTDAPGVPNGASVAASYSVNLGAELRLSDDEGVVDVDRARDLS